MRENANLRVVSQDFSPMVANGFDPAQYYDSNSSNNNNTSANNVGGDNNGQDQNIPRSPSLRSSGARPTSMIEMRDPNRQQIMHGVGGFLPWKYVLVWFFFFLLQSANTKEDQVL